MIGSRQILEEGPQNLTPHFGLGFIYVLYLINVNRLRDRVLQPLCLTHTLILRPTSHKCTVTSLRARRSLSTLIEIVYISSQPRMHVQCKK